MPDLLVFLCVMVCTLILMSSYGLGGLYLVRRDTQRLIERNMSRTDPLYPELRRRRVHDSSLVNFLFWPVMIWVRLVQQYVDDQMNKVDPQIQRDVDERTEALEKEAAKETERMHAAQAAANNASLNEIARKVHEASNKHLDEPMVEPIIPSLPSTSHPSPIWIMRIESNGLSGYSDRRVTMTVTLRNRDRFVTDTSFRTAEACLLELYGREEIFVPEAAWVTVRKYDNAPASRLTLEVFEPAE